MLQFTCDQGSTPTDWFSIKNFQSTILLLLLKIKTRTTVILILSHLKLKMNLNIVLKINVIWKITDNRNYRY